jgi:Tol biopolymer transport system component
MRTRPAAAAIATLSFALGAGCGSGGPKWDDENPAWSRDGREIAFDSTRADQKHLLHAIYVMNADGSGLRRLTGIDADLPRWSPDGSKLAYVGNLWQIHTYIEGPEAVSTSQAKIDLMNADGSGKRVLARSGYTVDVEWSPDGRWLAFDSGECCAAGSLKVVRANGGGLRTVARRVDLGAFAWSPNGRRLAFARSQIVAETSSLYVAQPATGKTTLLARLVDHSESTLVGSEVPALSWSPDGAWIAFVGAGISISGDSLEGAHAYVVNSRGGNLHIVSSPTAFPRYNDFTSGVAWLPGRRHLLLYNTDNGVYLTSTGRQHMSRINTFEGSPAVPSPDGTKFVFERYTSSGKNALYLQPMNGAAHQLTQAGKR